MSEYFSYFESENFKFETPTKEATEVPKGVKCVVSGDFYGIQKFIFDGLKSAHTAKVLRAKSAFVMVLCEFLAKNVADGCNGVVLSKKAGKFEVACCKPFDEVEKFVKELKKRVDEFFLKHFFGLSGVNFGVVACGFDDFEVEKFKAFRENLAEEMEQQKFRKFGFLEREKRVKLSLSEKLKNEELCEICGVRKGECKVCYENEKEKRCEVCDAFVKFGKKLASEEDKDVCSGEFFGLDSVVGACEKVKLTDTLRSYVCRDKNDKNRVLTFVELANLSCSEKACENGGETNLQKQENAGENECETKCETQTGLKALAVLKADVDNMGNFIREFDKFKDYKKFHEFSSGLDEFFSRYVPFKLFNGKHIYTVFGGGDDLFVVGAWDEVVEAAREIDKKFKDFVAPTNEKIKEAKNKKLAPLSISFGVVIVHEKVPVDIFSELANEAENAAKKLDENGDKKAAISLFGEVVKVENWRKICDEFDAWEKENFKFEGEKTAFLYRLLELCDMSKNVAKDFKNAMWKSKLNYTLARNFDEKKSQKLVCFLTEKIEKNPKETKMKICEIIYKRRER